jgi:hypothetical protein
LILTVPVGTDGRVDLGAATISGRACTREELLACTTVPEVSPATGMIGRLSMTDLGSVPLGAASLLEAVALGGALCGRAEMPHARNAIETRAVS